MGSSLPSQIAPPALGGLQNIPAFGKIERFSRTRACPTVAQKLQFLLTKKCLGSQSSTHLVLISLFASSGCFDVREVTLFKRVTGLEETQLEIHISLVLPPQKPGRIKQGTGGKGSVPAHLDKFHLKSHQDWRAWPGTAGIGTCSVTSSRRSGTQ